MNKTAYGKHASAATAMFLLGDAVLVLPDSGSGTYALFGFLLALVPALLLYAGMLWTANRLFADPKHNKGAWRWCSVAGTLFAAAAAFACAGICFKRFVSFAHTVMLSGTPKIWIALIFAVTVVFLLFQRNSVLLKLSLLLFVLSCFVILLFFILSVKDFKVSNIAVYYFPDLSVVWKETRPFLVSVALPAAVVPVVQAVLFGKTEKKIAFTGFVSGMLLQALCLADCLLLFGAQLASRLSYPLYSAVGTVTVGPLFTRMDGVIYYLFFSSALIKTTASLKTGAALCLKWRTSDSARLHNLFDEAQQEAYT